MGKHSQNGYSACDSSVIAKYTIPGSTITINLRKGDVSVVLLDFLSWYHKNIEPLHQNDTGGYNCRDIEGSNTLSNHASGTATDVRWNDHPRGKRNAGYSTAEISKINAKLKEYAGVIRWGNNYSSASTPDAMHFEINAGAAAVKKQADRIRAKNSAPKPTPKPTPKPSTGSKLPEHAPGSRTLKEGVSPGTDVAFVQRWIGEKHMGPDDGVPGPKFAAGVKWWQADHFGWKHPDGVLTKGGQSWHAMGH
jgi:hypothetical protein